MTLIFAFLLGLNILFAYFLKSDKRFFIGAIAIWTITVIFFLIYIFILFPPKNEILNNQEQKLFAKQIDKNYKYDDRDEWDSLQNQKTQLTRYNRLCFELVGLQTLITFILQIIGFRRTQLKKLYNRTVWLFGILTLVYLIIEGLIGIVPTSGIVG